MIKYVVGLEIIVIQLIYKKKPLRQRLYKKEI